MVANHSWQIINTYTEAVQTVDAMKATGKPHCLWVSFAKFYEENEQLDDVSRGGPLHLKYIYVFLACLIFIFSFLFILIHTYIHSGQDNI